MGASLWVVGCGFVGCLGVVCPMVPKGVDILKDMNAPNEFNIKNSFNIRKPVIVGLLPDYWTHCLEEIERTYRDESIKPSTKVSKLFIVAALSQALNRYSKATPSQAMISTGVPIATLTGSDSLPINDHS